VDDRDMGHRHRESVDVLDPSAARHRISVGGC